MSTILFNTIVFGPIKSRRLGNSLGINLLPRFGKLCNFDCIYCECGWNKDGKDDRTIPTKEEVFEELKERMIKLKEEGVDINTITFSGNGEPTLHPDFTEIIDFTIELRNEIYPNSKISVLTNATSISNSSIREALMKIDNPILKIDSSDEDIIRIIDQPRSNYSLDQVIENIGYFKGNYILQTMFLKGMINGKYIDLSSKDLSDKWVELVLRLKPREVMMYSLDRETPASNLEKVCAAKMKEIAAPLLDNGIKVQISGE